MTILYAETVRNYICAFLMLRLSRVPTVGLKLLPGLEFFASQQGFSQNAKIPDGFPRRPTFSDVWCWN
jgi:hypothetical protein